MQQAYYWHSSLLSVGGPAMCADFSECAGSATVFISACLSSCQNLSGGHMCFCVLILCVYEEERGDSFWQSICTVFFDFAHALINMCVCYFCLLVDRLLFGLLTVSLNHAAVVTRSDRMPFPPWDFSIRVSQALNEEVNMLNCLLEMKWRGCLTITCHVWHLHILVVLLEGLCITQWAYRTKSHLWSLNRKTQHAIAFWKYSTLMVYAAIKKRIDWDSGAKHIHVLVKQILNGLTVVGIVRNC